MEKHGNPVKFARALGDNLVITRRRRCQNLWYSLLERESLAGGWRVKIQRHRTRPPRSKTYRKRFACGRINFFSFHPLFSIFLPAQKGTPANETPPLPGFSPRSACLVKSPRTGVARRLLLFSGGRTLDTLLSGCTGVPLQRNRVITTYTSHDIPPLNQDG